MILRGIAGLSLSSADIVVVGAGPIGISLAIELARAGERVLLLESGEEKASPERQDLSRGFVADAGVHDELEITVSRQLGGTSNLWGARCQPFDRIDFETRTQVGTASWPIGYGEIAPYYARACEYANCGEPVFRAPHQVLDATDSAVDSTRVERFSTKPAFQLAHARELAELPNLEVRLGVTATEIGHVDGRLSYLTLQGLSGDVIRLPVDRVALAMGGLETTRLLLATQQKSEGLFGGPHGPLGRFYMAHVVGEVADVTWTSESIDAAFDFFLDGHGSYARRRMIPSDEAIRDKGLPNVSFWPVVPPVADPSHQSGLLSLVYLSFTFGPLGRILVAEAIRRYHAPPDRPKWPHVANVFRTLPTTLTQALNFLHRRYGSEIPLPGFFMRNAGRTYGLSYHAEHFPEENSRVKLTGEADRYGLPRLLVDLRFTRKDSAAIFRAHEHLRGWIERNGLGRLTYRQAPDETENAILAVATHGNHQIGLARMGASRKAGVVDFNLETFDIAGLYVASVAAFPTSGQANPTLTGLAFAMRLADHLKRQT
jgi:glycine/D-amino acid oxidase-like deaminating enzyme